MAILEADFVRVLRAAILKAVYVNHRQRAPRLSLVVLHGHLDKFFDLSEDDLVTLLEDLKDRGYVTYQRDEKLWKKSRAVRISQLQLTPGGSDLVEGTVSNPAVQFE